jgi:hypothetical protein
MIAHKLKGRIDQSGYLIVTEPIHLAPGEVEVIVLQTDLVAEDAIALETETPTKLTKRARPSKIKALQDWFENTEPAPADFDPEQARWEALKEKHGL